jgi:hypothetical protein
VVRGVDGDGWGSLDLVGEEGGLRVERGSVGVKLCVEIAWATAWKVGH